MKKILIVFHDPDSRSGATASMLSIVDSLLTDEDIYMEALIPNRTGDLYQILQKKNIKVNVENYYTCRFNCDTSKWNLPIRYFKAVCKIGVSLFSARHLQKKNKEKFDVIYSNTSDIYIGVIYSILSKTSHIWHVREFGIEDQNCRHVFGDRLFYKIATKYSKKIICISQALRNKVIKFSHCDNIVVVYNDILGQDIYENYNDGERNVLKENPRILVVGSIIPGKGQLDVINAIRILKRKNIFFELGIVGDDSTEYADNLKSTVSKFNLESDVTFFGYRKDVAIIRRKHDIGIVASNSEAFGRVTIEGMLAGLIMVATDSGANPELITDRENGLLYKNNDVNSLVSALEYLHLNQDKWSCIRNNAIDFAMQFTLGEAGKKIKKIIKD